jgi:hypothetical protein
MLRIGRDGDLFPHLAAHLKVFGNLVQIASELIGSRAKERVALIQILTVFPETVPRKGGLGVLSFIDSALPAFIGSTSKSQAGRDWRQKYWAAGSSGTDSSQIS